MNNMMLNGPDGVWRPAKCDTTGAMVVSGGGGGGGSGTSDTTEVTQLAVKAAVQSIDTKTPMLIGGAVPVDAAPRACVGRETIPLAAAGTASLTVPVGAVAAHVQADGASIRIRLDGQAPTATVGTRLDDGVIYPVDTSLAGVRLYGVGACNVQVVYFDRA